MIYQVGHKPLYSVGDTTVDSSGDVSVWDGTQWNIVEPIPKISLSCSCKEAVDKYHKERNLPGYNKLMKLFFDAYPEYKL